MATLLDHLLRLTDHRDRDHLELTLAKSLIDILPVDRVVLSRVLCQDGVRRWLDVASLDVRGGGKVLDSLRVDFDTLRPVQDHADRLRCVNQRSLVEVAWAGEAGPRITYVPLFVDSRNEDDGVVEIHAGTGLSAQSLQTLDVLLHVYRNMYNLLAYSDRDALTGLLNRKALDDTFYSAVLDEIDQGAQESARRLEAHVDAAQERRHRVPPNYWIGTVRIDGFAGIQEQHGQLVAEEVLLLVARIMNNTFRTYDRIYRLDGKQFAVLMHCPDEALVLAAFERLRLNMEKYNFPQAGHATVCAAFTRVTADDTPVTALERTGRGVDFARQHGGNRIVSHHELVQQGALQEAPRISAVDLF